MFVSVAYIYAAQHSPLMRMERFQQIYHKYVCRLTRNNVCMQCINNIVLHNMITYTLRRYEIANDGGNSFISIYLDADERDVQV